MPPPLGDIAFSASSPRLSASSVSNMTMPIVFPVSRLTSIIIPFASSSPGGRLFVSTSFFTCSIVSSTFSDDSKVATLTYTTAPSVVDGLTLTQANRRQHEHGVLRDADVHDSVGVGLHRLLRRDEPVGVRIPDQQVDRLGGREAGDRVRRRSRHAGVELCAGRVQTDDRQLLLL